jgi:hypothetical protein
MLALLISGLLLAFLVISIGHAAKSVMKLDGNSWDGVFLGFVVLNTICAWVSLILPVGIHLFTVLLVVTGLFALPRIRAVLATWREFRIDLAFLASLGILCTAAWLIASDFPKNLDTPLYHHQTVKWYEKYPVVPGLGNLHGRLAFNQNVFLLFSLTSLKDLFGQEIFSVNLVCFVIFSSYILTRIRDVHAVYGFKPIWFAYLLLALFLTRMPNLSSPSPDYLSQVLSFYIFARFIDMYLKGEESDYLCSPILLLLAVYAFTVKLSAPPMPLLFLIMLLMGKGPSIKAYVRILPAILLVIVPWMVRNVVMTGWLLFPFPSIDLFSFDWKIPYRDVLNEKISVTGWARIRGEQNYVKAYFMSLSEWFPVWYKEYFKLSLFEAVLTILGFLVPVVGFTGMLFGRIRPRPILVAVLATCAAGMLSWFWQAPTFRFGVGVISISAISFLLFFIPVPQSGLDFRGGMKPLQWVVAILTVLLMLWNKASLGVGEFAKPIGWERLLKPRLWNVQKTIEVKTAVNFEYSLPTQNDFCYDLDIPCTPYSDSTLALRGESLREGFRKGHH